jgi:hypothetical protein
MQAGSPLERGHEAFCHSANYRAMLAVTTDPAQREQIEMLLHEEEAKLKKYDEDNKKPPSSSKTA